VIPLKGMMIGNGFSDPENMLEYAQLFYGLGLIDDDIRIQLEKIQKKMKYAIQSEKWSQLLDLYDELGENVDSVLNITSIYNYAQEKPDECKDFFVQFLTQNHVRKSLHVGSREFEMCSDRVHDAFSADFFKTVRPWVEELVEHYPILFYNGQFDLLCSHRSSQNFLRNLHWSGASDYGLAKRQIWRVNNTAAGYYKTGSNVVDVFVHNAGHMVPTDQPRKTLILIQLFINKKLQNISPTVKDV
jgi:vitellogenic carboxypeptidase-like protein